jgi:predicted permease
VRTWRKLRLRLRSLLLRARVEQELDDELRFHLDHLVAEHEAAGMSRVDARQRALREIGGIEQRKEECRDARGVRFVDELRQDAAYALRRIRSSPGFTSLAVLSLALGIGANTTIFSFVNAVLLRPLPYPDSRRLVVLREQPRGGDATVQVDPRNFVQWRARARSFEALALVQTPPLTVMGGDGAEQVARVQTTSELFHVYGVQPALGRLFSEDETRPGGPDVVVLGYEFWRRRFGGDPGVVGRQLPVRDGPATIVGVAPAGLRIGLTQPDVYTPLAIDPARPESVGARSFQCYGRLRRDVGLDQARAEMTLIASTLARQYPFDEGYGVMVTRLQDYLVQEGRPALRLLMAVVLTVLLIACVNLGGLLASRGIARGGELALRASLGATPARLARQLLVESLMLASCGGAVALLLAYGATSALVRLTQGALTIGAQNPVGLDASCLLFTLAVSTVSALLFGVGPAWHASRVAPRAALAAQGRAVSADPRQQRLRAALVVAEVALAVVLLVGAGLLLRTFSSLLRVPLGFDPAQTVTMNLFLGLRPPQARAALVEQILDRVEALPGVVAAGTIQFLPLAGMSCGTGFWLAGETPGEPSRARTTDCSLVSRGYFAAMGIPVVEGRPFDRRDRMDSPRVVLVNRSFGKRYLADGRVLGRRILVSGSGQAWAQIVGVVADVRHNGLTSEPVPTVFLLHAQTPGYITNLVVRTTADPAAQAAAVRRAIGEVDPGQAVSAIKTMKQYLGDALARPRMYAALVACFALIAATLAATGIYGLVAFAVSQRTHEIGVRLALGADRQAIFLELVGGGSRLVIGGLLAGMASAAALGRVVSRLLFGVTPLDPFSYLTAAAVLCSVALVAVTLPAGRASRLSPMKALREE